MYLVKFGNASLSIMLTMYNFITTTTTLSFFDRIYREIIMRAHVIVSTGPAACEPS